MIEETELKKLKQDYPDFFQKTPADVIDFILSEKTAEKIAEIATKNGVGSEEIIDGIAQRVTWVLLNRLPSGNLAMTIELGLKISPETAKRIADEANRLIASRATQINQPKPSEPLQTQKELPKEKIIEEEPKRPKKPDVYHEPIE
jgi:hypothetical protein